jgi:AraC-like DNA-binding protein
VRHGRAVRGWPLERILALLHEGLAPAHVAGAAGFYDQSHLSRHFKSVCGMTPGQYAARVRADGCGAWTRDADASGRSASRNIVPTGAT